MAGFKSLVCLAFLGSIGLTFLILGCAINANWWSFFVLIFYLLAPIPTLIGQRCTQYASDSSSSLMDFCIFITIGFVLSAFALPVILYRAPQNIIPASACYLALSGNVVIFITLLGFFMAFETEDNGFWQI